MADWRGRFSPEVADLLIELKEHPVEKQKEMLSVVLKKLGGEEETAEEYFARLKAELRADKDKRVESREVKETREKLRVALQSIEELEAQVATYVSIDHHKAHLSKISENSGSTGEAEAIVIWSDWHIEETVEAHTVNGLNEYNIKIATNRIQKLFSNTLSLIETQRSSVDVRRLSLFLLGDMITGYIHEELKENNQLSPIESVLLAHDLLISGITYLLEQGNFDFITVHCMPGNHGRVYPQKQVATAYKNSYEWMMYNMLARHFGNVPNIGFNIPTSQVGYASVMGKTVRFTHGDAINYWGGIGGIMVPLNRWILRMDTQIRADLTILGHWHQYIQPSSNVLVNGSVIGLNPYAMRIGCTPEAPCQTLQLIDKRRGLTVRAPIFCS